MKSLPYRYGTLSSLMPERTYSESEVADIFARAAERERSAVSDRRRTGLTLTEVEQAAREAGLDVASVRAAAAEVDAGIAPQKRITVAERWIDGPLAEGAWEDLVGSLRQRFGASSNWWGKETSSLGAAQEWTHGAASGVTTRVMLSPREGGALLRVQKEGAGIENERLMGRGLAALFSFPIAMLMGALVAETLALGDAAGIAVVVLATFLGVLLGGEWIARKTRSERERLAGAAESLAEDLAQQLGSSSPPIPVDASALPQSRLDASLLDEAVLESGSSGERARARS